MGMNKELIRLTAEQFTDDIMSADAGDKCIVCGTPMSDYKPEYCCNGSDCGCRGMPIEPPVCSKDCFDRLMNEWSEV